MYKRETYMNRIRPYIGSGHVKILTGIRRSGKTMMLEMLQAELAEKGAAKSQFVRIGFEGMKNAGLRSGGALYEEIVRQLAGIRGKAYVFIDEAQEVDGWEDCIRGVNEGFDCDIYVTGSNAKMGGGNFARFVIYPFSFKEFYQLYSATVPNVTARRAFAKYLLVGGMPYLSNLVFEDAPSQVYLQDLYCSIVLKDIVRRNKVRDVDLLERIIAYIFNNIGATFSAALISKHLKGEGRVAAPETVLNYISYCADAFLVYQARRQDLHGKSGKKVLAVNERYYVADHGLREAVFGGNMQVVKNIFENIIYMEALRRGYNVTVGKVGTQEIDLICEKKNEKLYIQVAYILETDEFAEQKFNVYGLIHDHYPKYVISLDEADISRNGIKHRNIRDFLLTANWG